MELNFYGVALLARERQREMIEAAAERRVLRLARAQHPSRRRRQPPQPPQPPPAA